MLDPIDTTAITRLIDWDRPPCVSIHIPTERAGRETRQNRIRMKNAIDEAIQLLDGHPAAPTGPDTGRLLDPVRELLDDSMWWQHQETGLAVMAAPGLFETFRHPMEVTERVVVADRFDVKPLIRSQSENASFAVLGVSRNRIRLLVADRDAIDEVSLPEGTPASMDEAFWYLDREKQLQQHATSSRGSAVMFHGHGGPDDKDDRRTAEFLRAVAHGIREVVDGRLVVLAGVDELTARFRGLAHGLRIAGETVTGNADDMSLGEIRRRAWDVASEVLDEVRRADAESIAAGAGTTDLVEVLEAAMAGRVEALFIARHAIVWGVTRPAIEVHGDDLHVGDRDLLDAAVTESWARSGRVHVVAGDDVPGGGVAAASYRY